MNPQLSRSWASSTPKGVDEATSDLDALRDECTPRQAVKRQDAFPAAQRFVRACKKAGGVAAPVSQTFQDVALPRGSSERVDIVVHLGRAFE